MKKKIQFTCLSLALLTLAGLSLYYFNQGYAQTSNSLQDTDFFSLGQYYFNQDENPSGPYDLEKARYYYEQAVLEDISNHDVALYQLGRIDFLEGDFDEALYWFSKQIEYFADDISNVYYMIGLTNGYKARATDSLEDWQNAENGFLTYLDLNPDSPWARVDLSWVYFSQGKYDEMLPLLQLALLENPDNPWLLNMYGLALRNTGQEAGAGEYFVRALAEVKKLTAEDWGKSYPGNNPKYWGEGLEEFVEILEYNKDLAGK